MKTQRLRDESDFQFFGRCLAMSSGAGMIAENFTVCLDAAKVRLMCQKTVPGVAPKYTSVMQTVYRMAAEEGPRALFYGLGPGL